MGFFKKLTKVFSPISHLMGGKGRNPADKAMPYMNQIPDIGRQYMDPFIQQGQMGQEQVNPQYNAMTSDPNAFIENLMRNYSPSQGYQFKEKRMLDAMRNSAASGGFAGTPYDQENQAEAVQGMLGSDMQQFLQNLLGVQGAGLQGQENRIGRGYGAGINLADFLGNAMGNQAQLAFQGQAQRNADKMARRNMLFNLISKIGGNMMAPGG